MNFLYEYRASFLEVCAPGGVLVQRCDCAGAVLLDERDDVVVDAHQRFEHPIGGGDEGFARDPLGLLLLIVGKSQEAMHRRVRWKSAWLASFETCGEKPDAHVDSCRAGPRIG